MFEKLKAKLSSTPKEPSVEDMLTTYSNADFQEHGMEIMYSPQYKGVRKLFYEQYCEFCYEWVDIIWDFNDSLDRQSQPIMPVDKDSNHPILEKFEPEGFPILLVDGIVVRGITSSAFGRGFLQGFLEDEVMID